MADERQRYDDFDRLMLRHKTLIRRLCWWHASGDTALCADLVQDVLLALWRYRATLCEGASAAEEYVWVRLHTRSVLQHYRRRSKPVLVPIEESMAVEEAREPYSDTIAELAVGLSDYEHKALGLMLDGYSVSEMAKMLGIKPASVSQLRYRIVQKMREQSLRDHEKQQ